MLCPGLLTRVKEPGRFVCEGVNSGDIGALEAIAFSTSQAKIVVVITAAVLNCDNMIYVEIDWLSASAKAAILTASARPLKNRTSLLC